MNLRQKLLLTALILLSAAVFPATGAEISRVAPIKGIEWTFETTMGLQSISNPTMANESGSGSMNSQVLLFYGILFNSYFLNIPLIKAQMNLGFDRKTQFAWSERPDFNHDESLNESLRCIEVDAQVRLPFTFGSSTRFLPFAGYSFIEYSSNENISSSNAHNFKYNTIVFGVEYHQKISKIFSHTYYASYSPFLLANNNANDNLRYLNVGAEFKLESYPVALTLFFSSKKTFEKDIHIFEEDAYDFRTVDIGISFHTNL